MTKKIYANNPNKLQSDLKELNKVHIYDLDLHEIKNDTTRDYKDDFEIIGKMPIGFQIPETHIRYRNNIDYESCINAIDEDFESEDAIFNRNVYNLNTPQFHLVIRSQYENGCDFNHQIFEYKAINYFIPPNGYCFIKCINYLINSDYKKQHLDFIGNEKRRSNIMPLARIQPCLRTLGVNLGYFS